MKKRETGHRNLAVESRKWLTPYRIRPRQPRKTVRIACAYPYIPQVVVEAARDRMEMMMGTPLIKIGTAAQNRGVMDFLSERRGGGGGPPEDPDLESDDGIPRGFRG